MTRNPVLDYSAPLECDVAIAGAELAGVVAGGDWPNADFGSSLLTNPPWLESAGAPSSTAATGSVAVTVTAMT
jgi:hypothetical protein